MDQKMGVKLFYIILYFIPLIICWLTVITQKDKGQKDAAFLMGIFPVINIFGAFACISYLRGEINDIR